MPMPPYKRSHGRIGQSSHGSHNNFGGNGSKSAFGRKLNWGHSKDVKADFKSPRGLTFLTKKGSTRKLRRVLKATTRETRLRQKIIEDELHKRRQTNACINCGEVGHKFSNVPKPKP